MVNDMSRGSPRDLLRRFGAGRGMVTGTMPEIRSNGIVFGAQNAPAFAVAVPLGTFSEWAFELLWADAQGLHAWLGANEASLAGTIHGGVRSDPQIPLVRYLGSFVEGGDPVNIVAANDGVRFRTVFAYLSDAGALPSTEDIKDAWRIFRSAGGAGWASIRHLRGEAKKAGRFKEHWFVPAISLPALTNVASAADSEPQIDWS